MMFAIFSKFINLDQLGSKLKKMNLNDASRIWKAHPTMNTSLKENSENIEDVKAGVEEEKEEIPDINELAELVEEWLVKYKECKVVIDSSRKIVEIGTSPLCEFVQVNVNMLEKFLFISFMEKMNTFLQL